MLQMYRDFRRASRKVADADLRFSLKNQILSEFKSHKDKVDTAGIKGLMGEGARTLARLQSMSEVIVPDETEAKAIGGEEQGRVGTGWPWSR